MQLIIKGERKTEKDTKEEDYIHKELTYGTFERRFTLPEGVKTDEIKAKFANGILEITVPASAGRGQGQENRDRERPKVIEGRKEGCKKGSITASEFEEHPAFGLRVRDVFLIADSSELDRIKRLTEKNRYVKLLAL